MDKNKISKFRPILPARYNIPACKDWIEYFSFLGTNHPISYFDRSELTMRNFLMFCSLECTENGKIPLIVMSKEITPNLTLNFNARWFRDFFGTLKQLKVVGVIVTDTSDEGKEINSDIKRILEEESNEDWMVESIENLEELEGVCEKYIEKIEYINPISIEYREKK